MLEAAGLVYSVAFSPDGATLVVASGGDWMELGAVSFWDVPTRTQRTILNVQANWVGGVVTPGHRGTSERPIPERPCLLVKKFVF